jgi:signal transduction histidine kinase
MFRVQPDVLRGSTRALGDVSEVSRALDASRGEITDQLSRSGSDPVSRSAEAFLDAWGLGLRSVAERAEALGGKLHLASVEYDHAEQQLRGRLGNGPEGGPA